MDDADLDDSQLYIIKTERQVIKMDTEDLDSS